MSTVNITTAIVADNIALCGLTLTHASQIVISIETLSARIYT